MIVATLRATWPELAEVSMASARSWTGDSSRIRRWFRCELLPVTLRCEVCEAEPAQFMVFHHDIGRIELVVCAQHAVETPALLANIAVLRAKASAMAETAAVLGIDDL